MHVFAGARSTGRTEALAHEIEASGGRASALRCDTTQSADVAALFDDAQRETGAPPELVVYNAGNNRVSRGRTSQDRACSRRRRTARGSTTMRTRLRPDGELHVLACGPQTNPVLKLATRVVTRLDGEDRVTDELASRLA